MLGRPRFRDTSPGIPSALKLRHRRFICRTLRPSILAAAACVSRFSSTLRTSSAQSISFADIVTNSFAIGPPPSARDASQRGHFYLGERGHLNLGATSVVKAT